MVRQVPVSEAARQRLRDHQSAAAKVVASYASAMRRLDVVKAHRTEIVSQQDALVNVATGRLQVTVAAAADVLGADVAAFVLGLSQADVRRATKSVSQH